MTAPTEVDRPQESTPADITLVTRGITITVHVEVSREARMVVRPDAAAYARTTGLKPGDPVELFWRAGYEERTLPAKIVEIEDGDIVYWHLEATGPAERSQRRKAVRARLELPVQINCGDAHLLGVTVDLSEGGMRADVDGWGLPPEPGTPVQATVTLEKGFIDLRGEIVRQQAHGGRWQLSMKFEGIAEADQDRLRQRVFQALREERARAAD